MRGHIAEELAAADATFGARLETGSHRHATRRAEEMRAATELLTELDVPPRISEASRAWLLQLEAAPDQ